MGSPNVVQAIVPMKPIYEGKSRLNSVLSIDKRASLSLMLLQNVLQSINNTKTYVEPRVVGGDRWVQSMANQESAKWEPDFGGGPNKVVKDAALGAFDIGIKGIIVIPGDLGFLNPSDIDQMIDLSKGLTRAVIARATADGGTNAILMPKGMLIDPSFGPGSFERHLHLANVANIPMSICNAKGFEFDLDRPEDLLAYRQSRSDFDEALNWWTNKLKNI